MLENFPEERLDQGDLDQRGSGCPAPGNDGRLPISRVSWLRASGSMSHDASRRQKRAQCAERAPGLSPRLLDREPQAFDKSCRAAPHPWRLRERGEPVRGQARRGARTG